MHSAAAIAYLRYRGAPPGVYAVYVRRDARPDVFAKATPPGYRWITMHPHGKDEDSYVRVLVKINPDGSGNVVSGSGSLRGLRLNRLKSPDEWKENAQRRQQERRAKRKAKEAEAAQKRAEEDERAQADPEFARELERRRAEEAELEDNRSALIQQAEEGIAERQLKMLGLAASLNLPGWEDVDERVLTDPDEVKGEKLDSALRALNIDPSILDEDAMLYAGVKGGAGMIVGRARRKVTQALTRLRRDMVRELAENHELREQVLDGDDAAIAAEDALDTRPRGGLGFQKDDRAEAERRGVTVDDIRREARAVADDRLERLDTIDPDKAQAARRGRDIMGTMHSIAGVLTDQGEGSGPALATALTPSEAREHADKIKEFLRLSQEAADLEAKRREYAGDTADLAQIIANRSPGAFDIEVSDAEEDFLNQVRQDVEETSRMDLTKSFFETLNMESEGLDYDDARRAMLGHVNHAAYAHLNSALLTATGYSGMDRRVVDTLGMEAAAKVTAWRLRQTLDPDALEAVREGLATYHETASLEAMQDAMDEANQARAVASEIDLPDVTDATSLVLAKEMNRERQELLEHAITSLGTALGAVEAGAALNYAMGYEAAGDLTIDFGSDADTAQVLTGLHALGLDPNIDYDVDRGVFGNDLTVTLTESGMEKLSPAGSAQELATRARLDRIREGADDEADWLPSGFASYPASIHNDPARAAPLATPPGFGTDREPGAALEEFVASRLADGWTASDILRDAGSIDFVQQHIPPEQRDAYLAKLDDLFPLRDEDGNLRDVDKDPVLQDRYHALAREFVEAKHPGDADFHSQSIDPSSRKARQAAHLALAEDPRTKVAWTPRGELDPQAQRALRSYYLQEVKGIDPHDAAGGNEALRAALDDLGPEPEKMGQDLFGGESVTPEWSAWNAKRMDITEQFGTGESEWMEFVTGMRGLTNAYDAVQDHMRGRVAERYARYHANLTGEPLRLGTAALAHSERFEIAQDREARQAKLEQERADMAALRERTQGRFAAEGEGSVVEKLRKRLEQEAAFSQSEVALFGRPQPQAGGNAARDAALAELGPEPQKMAEDLFGGQSHTPEWVEWDQKRQDIEQQFAPESEREGVPAPEVEDPFRERYSLGTRAEAELASVLPYVSSSLDPNQAGVKMMPEVTMGADTRFVRQQRAIKFAKTARKSLLAMGMGSGKTNVQIGTFTELHGSGDVRKGLMVVPSVVRNQFGEEMARFTEPGQFRWHAQDDTFENRLATYRDPANHLSVVTHQTFRDDMLKIMADRNGRGRDEMKAAFESASPQERRQILRSALEDAGALPILDYVAMDEAHEALGREGKPDSFLQMVTDAAIQESKYAVAATGTPSKNDPSEVYDWLRKLDPDRWEGKADEFKRRFGVDMKVAEDAFKREAGRYIYASHIPSGANRTETWGARSEDGKDAPIPLTPQQQSTLDGMNRAYELARQARREGKADVEALKVLSPGSFEGQPEEAHQQIAEGLNRSLGTLRFAAQARIVDAAPAAHNAKVQHVLKLARERREKGQPGVVFAHSLAAVEQLRAALEADGHRVETVTGSDTSDAKAQKRRRFHPDRGDPDVDILVMSDAGATGMNLQRGEWLVNLDIPLTHKTLAQRNARIDRIGQKNNVEIHNLVADTPYDQQAVKRVQRKGVLHSVFTSDWEGMDDTGLAKHIHLARANREAHMAA